MKVWFDELALEVSLDSNGVLGEHYSFMSYLWKGADGEWAVDRKSVV